MDNDEQRDYAEEEYNRRLMREESDPEPEPNPAHVAELVELLGANIGPDRLVTDLADFFSDPGGITGYLCSPERNARITDADALAAFRVIASRHVTDAGLDGEAARTYLAGGAQ